MFVVGEPGELYLTHLSVDDGKGTTIRQALYKAIENTDMQNILSTIRSDGTPIMTGKHHGSIATLEELLHIVAMGYLFTAHERTSSQACL